MKSRNCYIYSTGYKNTPRKTQETSGNVKILSAINLGRKHIHNTLSEKGAGHLGEILSEKKSNRGRKALPYDLNKSMLNAR